MLRHFLPAAAIGQDPALKAFIREDPRPLQDAPPQPKFFLRQFCGPSHVVPDSRKLCKTRADRVKHIEGNAASDSQVGWRVDAALISKRFQMPSHHPFDLRYFDGCQLLAPLSQPFGCKRPQGAHCAWDGRRMHVFIMRVQHGRKILLTQALTDAPQNFLGLRDQRLVLNGQILRTVAAPPRREIAL